MDTSICELNLICTGLYTLLRCVCWLRGLDQEVISRVLWLLVTAVVVNSSVSSLSWKSILNSVNRHASHPSTGGSLLSTAIQITVLTPSPLGTDPISTMALCSILQPSIPEPTLRAGVLTQGAGHFAEIIKNGPTECMLRFIVYKTSDVGPFTSVFLMWQTVFRRAFLFSITMEPVTSQMPDL